MPNSTMAKVMSLIISLFDVALVQKVPLGIPQYVLEQKVPIQWLHIMASYLQQKIFCTCHTGYFKYSYFSKCFLIRTGW